VFGGAGRSLLELITNFPEGAIFPLVVSPNGQFIKILRKRGIPYITSLGMSQFDNTQYGYYRGWRWFILLRELFNFPSMLIAILTAKFKWKSIDLVHINEITLLPLLLLVKFLFNCPIFMHVRSPQRVGNGLRERFISSLLKRNVTHIIAIDQSVRNTLDPKLNIHIIHNSFSFNPDTLGNSTDSSCFKVGMIGSLIQAKGCADFIEAAAICIKRDPNIRFAFFGGRLRPYSFLRDFFLGKLNLLQDIEPQLRSMVRDLDLVDNVEFCPFTVNLESVYSQLKLVCFPSHFDAPGRPIFEAAFFGIPSVVAISKPLEDTLLNGFTGIAVSPKNPAELAEAIMFYFQNPKIRAEAGINARHLAHKNFNSKRNSLKIHDLYLEALAMHTNGCRL